MVDKTDEVIYIIRHSKDQNDSKLNLMERFGVTDLQAAAIVAMRLGQLSGMERIKIEDELAGILEKVKTWRKFSARLPWSMISSAPS